MDRLWMVSIQAEDSLLQLNETIGEKVKDLLIRSKLPGNDLMKIWYELHALLIPTTDGF